MYPHSGLWYRGTSACTLVPVFGTGEHPNVPSFRFLVPGNIRQNHSFGNHPFANPQFVRAGSWENGFFADFYFLSRRIFFPHFVGKVPKKFLQEIPGKKKPQKILSGTKNQPKEEVLGQCDASPKRTYPATHNF